MDYIYCNNLSCPALLSGPLKKSGSRGKRDDLMKASKKTKASEATSSRKHPSSPNPLMASG